LLRLSAKVLSIRTVTAFIDEIGLCSRRGYYHRRCNEVGTASDMVSAVWSHVAHRFAIIY
jgi:hypothetical protein